MHIEYYVKLGLKGIVEISSKHTESSSERDDDYEEEFVCLEHGQPIRMTAHFHYNVYSPWRGGIESRKKISMEEYERLVAEKGILDSEEWRAEQEALRKAAEEEERRREELMPNCPLCGAKMAIRENRTNGSQFFGCSKYPNCKGTRSDWGGLIKRIRGY